MPVKPIPEGHHTITPHLVVRDAAAAIDFYRAAFGAEEVMRMPGPDGRTVMHGELKIGDSMVYLCDEFPQMGAKGPKSIGGTPVTLHMYVRDADAAFQRATAAGATVKMPLQDAFWGDRYGILEDPFGHTWSVGQHLEDLTPDQIARRAKEAFSSGCCGG